MWPFSNTLNVALRKRPQPSRSRGPNIEHIPVAVLSGRLRLGFGLTQCRRACSSRIVLGVGLRVFLGLNLKHLPRTCLIFPTYSMKIQTRKQYMVAVCKALTVPSTHCIILASCDPRTTGGLELKNGSLLWSPHHQRKSFLCPSPSSPTDHYII